MAVIKREQGKVGIYNNVGLQVEGSFSANMEGLNPKELFEASLGLCITIVLNRLLERDGIEVKDDDILIEVNAIKASDSPSRFEQCEVGISLPDNFSEEYKKKLIVSAERACTIGNTLRKGLKIHTENLK
ncbi:OsmC family protein [Robertmurraya massiliosenegalensis]|uniref:OsmC family protein n=1 Tax=Robertmurraya TaxID=2837507 RepID=UPI0039A415A0